MDKVVDSVKKGQPVSVRDFKDLPAELFEIKLTPKKEFAVANIGNNIVALDIELTDELIKEGILRELVRALQVCRKEADFDIQDRIYLDISSSDSKLQSIISDSLNQIKNEVLVKEFKSLDKAELVKEITINDAVVVVKMQR